MDLTDKNDLMKFQYKDYIRYTRDNGTIAVGRIGKIIIAKKPRIIAVVLGENNHCGCTTLKNFKNIEIISEDYMELHYFNEMKKINYMFTMRY